MKKFVFIIVSIILSSCASTYLYTSYGDITIMDNNGKVLREYDNATIEVTEETIAYNYYNNTTKFNMIKQGGSINFIDNNNVTHFVSGGIVIVDNIKTNVVDKYVKEEKEREIEEKKVEYENYNAQMENEEKKVDKLIEKYKEYQDNYIALCDKKPTTNNKTKQRDLAGKIIKTEIKLKEKGIDYLEYRNKDLISGGEDALSEIYRIVNELKHLDENIVTIVDKKELKEAKHKIYELSQTLWEKYNVSYKKL